MSWLRVRPAGSGEGVGMSDNWKKDFIISKRVLDEHVCIFILGIWGLEIKFFVVVDIYDEGDHWIKSQP